MIAHAEAVFHLNQKLDDGSTRRDHYEAARNAGATVPQLDVPQCPPEAFYLLQWFADVASGRTGGGLGGPAPLGWAEILAWSRLRGIDLHPIEVDAIRQLDGIFLQSITTDGRHQRRNAG